MFIIIVWISHIFTKSLLFFIILMNLSLDDIVNTEAYWLVTLKTLGTHMHVDSRIVYTSCSLLVGCSRFKFFIVFLMS